MVCGRIHLPLRQKQVRSLGREDPLEKKMATHSSVPAWRILWTDEPGGIQYVGLQRVALSRKPRTLLLSPGEKRFGVVPSQGRWP